LRRKSERGSMGLHSLFVKLRTLLPFGGLLAALLVVILRSRQAPPPAAEPGTWDPFQK
jgi:hypothetical protein